MEKDSKGISPIRAIRAKCLECSNGRSNEVKLCPVERCPLYPLRFGHNPNKQRALTDEQRQALAERMRAVVNEQRRIKNRTPPEG